MFQEHSQLLLRAAAADAVGRQVEIVAVSEAAHERCAHSAAQQAGARATVGRKMANCDGGWRGGGGGTKKGGRRNQRASAKMHFCFFFCFCGAMVLDPELKLHWRWFCFLASDIKSGTQLATGLNAAGQCRRLVVPSAAH
jgi:hypothetical protein